MKSFSKEKKELLVILLASSLSFRATKSTYRKYISFCYQENIYLNLTKYEEEGKKLVYRDRKRFLFYLHLH